MEAYMDTLVNVNLDQPEPDWQVDENKIPVLQYAIFYCSNSDPENSFILNLKELVPNNISDDNSIIILNGFITPKSQVIQATRLSRLLNEGDSIVLCLYNPEPIETEIERINVNRLLGTVNYSIKYK